MAAIVSAPPVPRVDPDLQRFREYAVGRHGASHVTEESIKKAWEAEISKPYGRELLLSKIDAYQAAKKPIYQAWQAEGVIMSGTWHSTATDLVVERLYSNVLLKQVSASFSGGHFVPLPKREIQGTLYYNDLSALDGELLAIITTSKNECSGKHELTIDWMGGVQSDTRLATFSSPDFPFEIHHSYEDSKSKWSPLLQ